jgi:hypothetical protein
VKPLRLGPVILGAALLPQCLQHRLHRGGVQEDPVGLLAQLPGRQPPDPGGTRIACLSGRPNGYVAAGLFGN